MSAGHSHAEVRAGHERVLLIALGLTTSFMVAEVGGLAGRRGDRPLGASRTWVLLKESINILLQGVPEGVDIGKLEAAIRRVAGVADVHDLHVWGLTSGKSVMSCHIVAHLDTRDEQSLLTEVTRMARDGFEIEHITLQIESSSADVCGDIHSHTPH